MELLTIAEVARRTGVAATTLRYYDSLGLLRPERLGNNHRRYGPDALDSIRLIRACQALGCSLDEIRTMVMPGGGAARRSLAREKLAAVEGQLRQLAEIRAVLTHFAECTHEAGEQEECRRAVMRVPAG